MQTSRDYRRRDVRNRHRSSRSHEAGPQRDSPTGITYNTGLILQTLVAAAILGTACTALAGTIISGAGARHDEIARPRAKPRCSCPASSSTATAPIKSSRTPRPRASTRSWP